MTSTRTLYPDDLRMYDALIPEFMREIIKAIGVTAALKVVEKHGGKELMIYKTRGSRTQCDLAEHVGEEAAYRLAQFALNDRMTIPACSKLFKALRNDSIRGQFDHLTQVEKLSSKAAVRRLVDANAPIHERSIWRILSRVGH